MRLIVCLLALGISSAAVAADSKFAKSTPALVAKGKKAYLTNCATCHGDKADGNGPAGSAMNPKPRNFVTDAFKAGETADAIFETTSKGLKGTAMPGFSFIPEEDRWAISHYIASLRKKK